MKITATIKVRRSAGWDVKPAADLVDGMTHRFSLGWVMNDEDDPLIAWLPDREGWPDKAPTWMASGDLAEIIYDNTYQEKIDRWKLKADPESLPEMESMNLGARSDLFCAVLETIDDVRLIYGITDLTEPERKNLEDALNAIADRVWD